MTNALVGEVYLKIIEEVIKESKSEFEENGVSVGVLNELQQSWHEKLSAKQVAQMPWDPKPPPPSAQQPPSQASSLPSATNGLPPSYSYNTGTANGGSQIKSETGADGRYGGGLPNGYAQNPTPTEGGLARAQQLVQQYGSNQAQRGGLALPGQRPPQGLQLPGQQNPQQQQYAQQQYMQQQRQQAALQQQQAQPRIKVENDSPQLQQGGFQQQPRHQQHAYPQTDGADDGHEEWQRMLAKRRAAVAEHGERADRMMRERVLQNSSDLQSGLMMPLDEQPKHGSGRKRSAPPSNGSAVAGPSVPQLDGELDDEKLIKDEDDDSDAINSALDSDEETAGAVGDDDDDLGDTILCTYDKVQRVKNKWKCTLKDGVMAINGKEWVFHKGMGEFEW